MWIRLALPALLSLALVGMPPAGKAAGTAGPAAAGAVSSAAVSSGAVSSAAVSSAAVSSAAVSDGPIAMADESSYRMPLNGSVKILRTFLPPAQRYGPGHLGVDLAAAQGSAVLAAGAGVVRFAGMVAGRGVVVIAHLDGLSTEYEPVETTVLLNQPVGVGQAIGRVSGIHLGCPAASCLHWGARRGTEYLDPTGLLQPLGVLRLLPWSDQLPSSDQ